MSCASSREVAFGKALLQFLEALERRLGLALILILATDLIVVTQPDVVGDELEILAGRMHPLEIVERADRLRVVLLLVVGEADFHLGVFGVGAERILVDHLLIIFDRGLVFFGRKIKLALRVVVFAGGLLAQTTSGGRQQNKSHQYQQQAFHRRVAKRLNNAVRHCNPRAILDSAALSGDKLANSAYFWTRAACRNEAEKTGLPAATYLRANPVRSAPGAASTARMNPAASIIGKISAA